MILVESYPTNRATLLMRAGSSLLCSGLWSWRRERLGLSPTPHTCEIVTYLSGTTNSLVAPLRHVRAMASRNQLRTSGNSSQARP